MKTNNGTKTAAELLAAATPGPWKIDRRSSNPLDIDRRSVLGANMSYVANTCQSVHVSLPEQVANAELIARAVNAFGPMVEALGHLSFLSLGKYDDATWRNAWIQASEALAIANGESNGEVRP